MNHVGGFIGRSVSLWRRGEADPVRLALVEPDGTRISYAELVDLTRKLQVAFAAMGLERGDRVAVLLGNGTGILATVLATHRSGLYAVPINTHLTAGEVRFILEDSEAAALVTCFRFAATAEVAASGVSTSRCLSVDGGIPGFLALSDVDGEVEVLDETRAGALMMYTSGTTGRPRGVWRPLGEQSPDEQAETAADFFYARFPDLPESYGGAHLVVGPMYHAQPLIIGLHALTRGQPLVLVDGWDSAHVLDLIGRHQVTTSAMVPTMFLRLLGLPEPVRAAADCRSLRRVFHAAAPCPIDTKRRMLEWWGPVLDEYYGSTEVGGTSITSGEWLLKPGSVGRPYAGAEIRILDADGQACPAEVPGRVYLRLRWPFEYYKDPVKTMAQRIGDFVTVGDIGYLDRDGYLFLVDRESDLIISGGVNIYPAEIEAILAQHPAVQDAAVVGIPDSEWGESVHAVVVLPPGTDAAGLDLELMRFCRLHLAAFKCPRSVEFRESLPRLESGKLQRGKVREEFR